MKRIAHIQNNEIASVSLADDEWVIPQGCMLESDAVALGYPYMQRQQFKIWSTKTEFWDEFTMQEKIAIANSTNDMIKFFFAELMIWTGEVWSNDDRVIQGVNLLVSEQIITQQKCDEILNNLPV
jgi:hypothetical protein